MAMDGGEDVSSHIDAIFRAVHSVKGGAGAFGFNKLVEFAHVFETVLDQVRQGALDPGTDVLQILLQAGDVLNDLVTMAESNAAVPDGYGQDVRAKLHELELRGQGGGGDAPMEDFDDLDFTPVAATDLPDAGAEEPAPEAFDGIEFQPVPAEATGSPSTTGYRISFAPRPELFRRSNEPLLLFRELRRLGTLTVACDVSALPGLNVLLADGAYLR